MNVSIHAPLARGDLGVYPFQSDFRVSIHAPLARGDLLPAEWWRDLSVSIHALLRGATLYCWEETTQFGSFNPRPSCEGRLLLDFH